MTSRCEPALAPSLRDQLTSIVGPGHVIIDRERLATYERDWTGRWHGRAISVVRPRSSSEVSGIMAACDAARIGVVVQGGNTGLAGGA
ncbi:MAG TPA: FAD-binding oxidoreductase, partial [Chloroflexota bacterium]